MDRFWFLTTTFYGNWLPGDPRGFVSRVRDRRPGDPECSARQKHNVPGTEFDTGLTSLRDSAHQRLSGKPVRVSADQAEALLVQFRETAAIRGWSLIAVAIMANHVHILIGVDGDPDLTKVLGDFKAYGSRALTVRWGRPASGTWWTYAGSKRRLEDEASVFAAVSYIREQEYPLCVWVAPAFVNAEET